jgi:two-component system phosphate regulon sensor histidine kinase PhoR
MSISLLGIILIQVYWFNTSLEKSEEQFKFHIKQVLGNVSRKLGEQEKYTFYNRYNKLKDSIGSVPKNEDLMEYKYYQRNKKTNETIIYSNSIISEDYDIFSTLFDKKKSDNSKIKAYTAKRKTEIFNKNSFDNLGIENKLTPDITI